MGGECYGVRSLHCCTGELALAISARREAEASGRASSVSLLFDCGMFSALRRTGHCRRKLGTLASRKQHHEERSGKKRAIYEFYSLKPSAPHFVAVLLPQPYCQSARRMTPSRWASCIPLAERWLLAKPRFGTFAFRRREINASGGVLGKKLEPIVVDGASNWPREAKLLHGHGTTLPRPADQEYERRLRGRPIGGPSNPAPHGRTPARVRRADRPQRRGQPAPHDHVRRLPRRRRALRDAFEFAGRRRRSSARSSRCPASPATSRRAATGPSSA